MAPPDDLAEAYNRGSVSGVLEAAQHLENIAEVKTPSKEKMLELAEEGKWCDVAYYLAIETAKSESGDEPQSKLPDWLKATDQKARQELKAAMGVMEARLPRDLAASSAKKGRGCGTAGKHASALGPEGLASDFLVEQPRWMMPRPRPDDCFVLSQDGKTKLAEGWYSVAQYPASDDPREALLWKKPSPGQMREVAKLLDEVGETLLCKAVKAGKWELVEWLFHKHREESADAADQVSGEYAIFNVMERTALVDSLQDIDGLRSCLASAPDGDPVLLKPWRLGRDCIPAGSTLKLPAKSSVDDWCRAAARLDLARSIDIPPRKSHPEMQELIKRCHHLTFEMKSSSEVKKKWTDALASAGEVSFRRPLLHRAILASVSKPAYQDIPKKLIDADVSIDACDSDGLTALAVTATARQMDKERQMDTLEMLLDAGCSADGRSGSLVKAALQRASKPSGRRAEETTLDHAAHNMRIDTILEKLRSQEGQAPFTTLTDYFRAQARGKMVLSRIPRRFKFASDGSLELRKGSSQKVWGQAAILDPNAADYDVMFLESEDAYDDVSLRNEPLDLVGKSLVPESALRPRQSSVAVALHRSRIGPREQDGSSKVRPAAAGPLALSLPVIARLPPVMKLRVTSETACCACAINRVEVLVDGTRVRETGGFPGAEKCEAELTVPKRILDINFAMSGRKILPEPLKIIPDDDLDEHELAAEVPLAIHIYSTLVDKDDDLRFVSVCGHRQDLPDDPPAEAIIGTVTWNGGSTEMTSLQPVVLGGASCIEQLKSLMLMPKNLKPGFVYEHVDWEDTGECQFKRLLVAPVRIGKIWRPS